MPLPMVTLSPVTLPVMDAEPVLSVSRGGAVIELVRRRDAGDGHAIWRDGLRAGGVGDACNWLKPEPVAAWG